MDSSGEVLDLELKTPERGKHPSPRLVGSLFVITSYCACKTKITIIGNRMKLKKQISSDENGNER